MEWVEQIKEAVQYIENNLTNDICPEDVSKHVFASKSHFQRIFSVVTGFTISDYIRNRRLSAAGLDLLLSKSKVIDIAMRYQYDTSESFSKAFTRFHGFAPSAVKMCGDKLKCFDPISIDILIQGGFNMSRKIMSNDDGVRLIREKFEYKISMWGICVLLVLTVKEQALSVIRYKKQTNVWQNTWIRLWTSIPPI